jgi:hypothetical protein
LPDGLFSDQKWQFGYILDTEFLEDVCVFYGHSSILRSFDIFYGHLRYFVVIGIFFPVLVYCSMKNLAALDVGRN